MATLARETDVDTIKVIDADAHLTEPRDLWTSRALAPWCERVTQVGLLDGRTCWAIDGDRSIDTGAHPSSAILKNGAKVRYPDRFMAITDQTGIPAHVVYPNILSFDGQAAAKADPKLRLIRTRIDDDAMAKLQESSGGRLHPTALLPWRDISRGRAENGARGGDGIARHQHRFRSAPSGRRERRSLIPISAFPAGIRCGRRVDKVMPMNFHIGASETPIDHMGQQGRPPPPPPHDLKFGASDAMPFFDNGKVIANLACSGLLDRLSAPALRFGGDRPEERLDDFARPERGQVIGGNTAKPYDIPL